MKLLRSLAAAMLAVSFLMGGNAVAQDASSVPGLTEAIAAGDTVALNNITAANIGNPAVLAVIANALLAAA